MLLDLPTLSATNHNGGAIHFGIDGLLYIGVGENAVGDNAQSLSTPLGKILRINADGSIPASNPFFGQTTGNSRAIWALGLRNPFTFTIEPSSGRMLINDVGQDIWEEINEGQAAANYGWPLTEGPTSDSRFVTPLYAYTHADGCAISGGAFYPALPSQYPAGLPGRLLFCRLLRGWIRQFDFTTGLNPANFASGIASPVDLLIGPEGALYYLARGSAGNTGTVVRIDFTGSAVPRITQHPANQTVSVGQAVTFAVSASGSALSYQWQRNAVDIAGATSASYTLSSAQLADNGAQFRCRVTNDAGQVFSSVATLTLVESRPPVPTIMTPATGALYTARASVGYSGSATDPEDGMVPASRFTWNIVFHHDTHTHPFLGPIMGRTSGSFAVPNVGETSANVWYRITLTVTDSSGQQASTFRDVRPRTVQVTLAANPSGMMLTLDGQPVVAPFTFTSVVGMRRTIAAISQSADNVSYGFGAWSDRGAQEHTVTTPASNTTFTAVFRKQKGGNGGAVAVKRPSVPPVQQAIPKTAVPRPSD